MFIVVTFIVVVIIVVVIIIIIIVVVRNDNGTGISGGGGGGGSHLVCLAEKRKNTKTQVRTLLLCFTLFYFSLLILNLYLLYVNIII